MIKVLVSGFENSGKTTLVSKIKDSLLLNFDAKSFNMNIPYSDIQQYAGFSQSLDPNIPPLKTKITDKIKAYIDAYGNKPKWVIFDTITQLYLRVCDFNNKNYIGYNAHSQNDNDTNAINDFIELLVKEKEIGVIITSHMEYDEKTGRYSVPAQGKFKKIGSWLSVVNEGIHIRRTDVGHIVHVRNEKGLPCRTLLDSETIRDSYDINEFDINEYLNKILSIKQSNKHLEL